MSPTESDCSYYQGRYHSGLYFLLLTSATQNRSAAAKKIVTERFYSFY